MFLEIKLVGRMEETVEKAHRVKKQPFMKSVDRLPAIKQLSCDNAFVKSCNFKEFRFAPPYVSQKKEHKGDKLSSITEHILPRRHNSLNEDDNDVIISDRQPLPFFSISPAFVTEMSDEQSVSVEAIAKSLQSHLFNSREFTFPESSAKRQMQLPSQPSIVPAFTPRVRDTSLHVKIEKIAKLKRKERVKRAIDKRYERKLHNMTDMPDIRAQMAFKTRREPDLSHPFPPKDHKYTPFKQMVRIVEETDKHRFHPRLYTRILDSIITYTKGIHDSNTAIDQRGSYKRLLVTSVTVKENYMSDMSRQLTFLPPIT